MRTGETTNEEINFGGGGARGSAGDYAGECTQKASTSAHKKSVTYVAADKATFKAVPTGGVSMATIWGVNPDKGAHGTFTKFGIPGTTRGCTLTRTMSRSW